jgi:hypothetical protein
MCAAPVESTGSKLEVFLDNVNHMQLNRKYMHIATWKAYHMICVLKFWRIHIKCLIILFFGYQKLVLLVIMAGCENIDLQIPNYGVKISTYRFMFWKPFNFHRSFTIPGTLCKKQCTLCIHKLWKFRFCDGYISSFLSILFPIQPAFIHSTINRAWRNRLIVLSTAFKRKEI